MTASNIEAVSKRWDRHIPHYALTAELLPGPQAPWGELVYFAGAFDAIVAPASHGVEPLALASRERFLSDGTQLETLPASRASCSLLCLKATEGRG